MSTEDLHVVLLFLFVTVLLGGVALVGYTFIARQRLRELAVKERIALIEKGLIPSPEVDPVRFESLIGLRRPTNPTAVRYQSAGVILMGLGLALAVLLVFAAGRLGAGVGVGGGLAVLGLAVYINGSLLAGDDTKPRSPDA